MVQSVKEFFGCARREFGLKPVKSTHPGFSAESLTHECAWPKKELLPEDVQKIYRQIEGRSPKGMVLAPIDLLDDWGTDVMAEQSTTAPLNDRIEAFNLVITSAQQVVGVSRFCRARTWIFFHVSTLAYSYGRSIRGGRWN